MGPPCRLLSTLCRLVDGAVGDADNDVAGQSLTESVVLGLQVQNEGLGQLNGLFQSGLIHGVGEGAVRVLSPGDGLIQLAVGDVGELEDVGGSAGSAVVAFSIHLVLHSSGHAEVNLGENSIFLDGLGSVGSGSEGDLQLDGLIVVGSEDQLGFVLLVGLINGQDQVGSDVVNTVGALQLNISDGDLGFCEDVGDVVGAGLGPCSVNAGDGDAQHQSDQNTEFFHWEFLLKIMDTPIIYPYILDFKCFLA